MDNWFVDEKEEKRKLIFEIMQELEYIVDEEDISANHYIDDRHNVFAWIVGDDEDKWIEIHYELYDHNEDIIGDLLVLSTESVNREELLEEITTIVNTYYNDKNN